MSGGLVHQIPPKTDTDGDVNGYDIAILLCVLCGTMTVGIIATIHAGEAKCLSFLPCAKKYYKTDNESGSSSASSPSNTNANPNASQRPSDRRLHSDLTQLSPNKAALLLQDSIELDANESTVLQNDRVQNFFLADRGMKWYLVGGALFASNIGAEHFVGMAGDGARRGLAVAMYEWYAAILIILLGWIFAPIYRRAGVYTTPEFLQLRYSAGCRHYLSAITCIMYVLTKMSASIYGGAVVLQSTLGWNLYVSAGACICLSTMYTVAGGLRAVMYTDLFQMCVFVTGGIVVSCYSLYKIGGFEGIEHNLHAQGKDDHWQLFQPISDKDYPWTGMLIGQPIGSVWYWCMDQDLVQRVLSAKDTAHSKAGCSFASLLKILPPFIIVVPGIVASIMYDMSVPERKTDAAYPVLLTNLMPHGIIGLMIASIITAMMSSLASVFSAGSSVVANDIYLRLINPKATHTQLVLVGRLSTAMFAVLSFCWIPILSNGQGLYKHVVEIQSYLTPPIGIVLLLGVFWKRANAHGALSGLLLGGALGIVRLLFVTINGDKYHGKLPTVVNAYFYMNFQHFAILLWVTAAITCITVSLCTAPPKPEALKYMVQWDSFLKYDASELKKPRYVNWMVSGSAILSICITFSLWIYFA